MQTHYLRTERDEAKEYGFRRFNNQLNLRERLRKDKEEERQ